MKVKIVTSLEELPVFDTEKPIFSDIESQGLYIKTRLIQLYQPNNLIQECETCGSKNIIPDKYNDDECYCNSCGKQRDIFNNMEDTIYILDLAPIGFKYDTYEKLLKDTKEYLKQFWLVFYNASYDLGTLNLVPKKVDDLFYAVKTAYPHFMEFSLDKVTSKLPYTKGMYEGLDKKKLQKQGFVLGAYLSTNQIKYSATDVLALAKMWADERIQSVINKNLAYKVDILSLEYAIQYQQNGLHVDLPERNRLLLETVKTIEKLEQELPAGMNVNSFKQVRAYLNTNESDNEALVKYSLSDRPLASKAKVIIDLKKAKKELSYLESINFEKMYTKFNVAGAQTGRFTASGGDLDNGFNAQQIPRKFQKLFKADKVIDGIETTVVGLDYSTLELRLACTIFGEPEMYRQLKDGEDLHSSMASLVTGKKVGEPNTMEFNNRGLLPWGTNDREFLDEEHRQNAKAVNFGYVFGMSAGTYQNYAFVSYGVKVTLEESQELRNKYFQKYPEFKKYHNNVWNNYKRPDFYYETALGRRVKPKLGTDGINGPVQGSGAETTKLAVRYLLKEYPEAINYVFNVVHDAIYLRVPKKDKDLWSSRLSWAMKKGWTEISKSKLFKYKDIPMPVEE